MEASFSALLPLLSKHGVRFIQHVGEVRRPAPSAGLKQHGVRFIVIGGGAAIAHGAARLT